MAYLFFLCESVNSRAAFCGNNKFLGVNVFASLQYRDKVTFYCLRSFCVVMTDKKGMPSLNGRHSL